MNPQNQQTPGNYLDQIAPQQQKKPLFALNARTLLVGGGLLVALIVIISLIVGSSGNSRLEPWQRLSARLTTTSSTVEGATSSIKNNRLKSINSELKIYLANTQRDIATPLKTLEINTAKLPPAIIASESGEAMAGRLEDARLNAKYDSTYAREMAYQLSMLMALLSQVYNSSGSATNKALLEQAYNSLKPIQENLANYSASTE